MKSARVLLIGAKGRMGRAIMEAARTDTEARVVGECDRGDDIAGAMRDCDVVVDFSQPETVAEICRGCVESSKALVMGTTGHSPAQLELLRETAQKIPVLHAPNFSIGVNALFWLAGKAADLLGEDFDVEISEMHHRHKKDAPSGTAKKLAEILAAARKLDPAKDLQYGRKGMIGDRSAREIGIHSLRGGDVVGDHTVIFAGPAERLELTHRASSRETFARGALRAARWIMDKPAGFYGMDDMLHV
jgi:4-hydroxy-tetrahydrodipicolinate reductase